MSFAVVLVEGCIPFFRLVQISELGSKFKIQKTNRTEQFTDYDVESFHRFVAYLNARGAEAGASGDIGRVLL